MLFTVQNIAPEPVKKKTKLIPKIFNGKFYVVQNESNGNIKAKCTVCGDVRKGNISSTGNFISHYKTKHSSKLNELKEYLKSENGIVNSKSHQPTLVDIVQTITPDMICS